MDTLLDREPLTPAEIAALTEPEREFYMLHMGDGPGYDAPKEQPATE